MFLNHRPERCHATLRLDNRFPKRLIHLTLPRIQSIIGLTR